MGNRLPRGIAIRRVRFGRQLDGGKPFALRVDRVDDGGGQVRHRQRLVETGIEDRRQDGAEQRHRHQRRHARRSVIHTRRRAGAALPYRAHHHGCERGDAYRHAKAEHEHAGKERRPVAAAHRWKHEQQVADPGDRGSDHQRQAAAIRAD